MSDTLYQITQTAAHVCSVLPLPAPGLAERLDRWAYHWQSLLGSVVGGIGGGVLGLLGAVMVAVMAGHRERRVAARALLPELRWIVAAHEALANEYSYDRQEDDTGLQDDLLARRPKLATLVSPAATALYDIDNELSAHLSNCLLYYEAVEGDLAAYRRVLEEDSAMILGSASAGFPFGPPVVSRLQMADRQRMQHIEYDWNRLAESAALTAHLLQRFVISRRPRWLTRLLVRLWPTDRDRLYAQQMETVRKREQRLGAADA